MDNILDKVFSFIRKFISLYFKNLLLLNSLYSKIEILVSKILSYYFSVSNSQKELCLLIK